MVDVRPLLFINFLFVLLIASAGFVQLHQANSPSQAVNNTAAVDNQPQTAPNDEQTKGNDALSEERSSEPQQAASTAAEEPIFADQLPPTKDPKILNDIANLEKRPDGEPIIFKAPSSSEAQAIAQGGKLSVRSNVYGDTVLINGRPYGSSALEVELAPGSYDVEVTKPGFQNWKQSIHITRGSTQTVVAELQKFTTVNYRNGVWEHGVQTGEGRYQDGARVDYQGSFVNGQFHGYGSARYGNGSKYQGEWFEGKRKGQGTFVDSNGDTFVGQLSDNEFNGDGTLTKANGDIYTGYWIDGELNGQGSLTTRDGLLYVGGFSDNLFHGSGTLTYPDGGTYEGSFSNGLFHGKGVEVYANGKKYEGQFIEGLYHGKGEILNPNGSKISGTFKDGEPFGKVTLTTAEGEVFTARSSEPGVCYRPKSYRATQCPKLDGW